MEGLIYHGGAPETISIGDTETKKITARLAMEVREELAAVGAKVDQLERHTQLEYKLAEMCRLQEDITSFSEGLEQSKKLSAEINATEWSSDRLRELSMQLQEEMLRLRQKSVEMHAEYETVQQSMIRELCRQEDLRRLMSNAGAHEFLHPVSPVQNGSAPEGSLEQDTVDVGESAESRESRETLLPLIIRDSSATTTSKASPTAKPARPHFGMLLGSGVRRPGKRAMTFATEKMTTLQFPWMHATKNLRNHYADRSAAASGHP